MVYNGVSTAVVTIVVVEESPYRAAYTKFWRNFHFDFIRSSAKVLSSCNCSSSPNSSRLVAQIFIDSHHIAIIVVAMGIEHDSSSCDIGDNILSNDSTIGEAIISTTP